uniref:Uncharacterized protein n=1 Tax=Anguilla anguilla TaxID=7936 RepID=A0A0E9PJF3_ANGAN
MLPPVAEKWLKSKFNPPPPSPSKTHRRCQSIIGPLLTVLSF